MKSMKLDEIIDFINHEANKVHVDSFSGLMSQLTAIPGVETIKLVEKKSLTKKLANLFSPYGDNPPKGITLETKHYIYDNSIKTDYEIGFHNGEKWIILAWGWYNKFVSAMSDPKPAAEATAPETVPVAPPEIILPRTVPPVSTPIQ